MLNPSLNKQSAIVFGSINLDLVARTGRLPVPGETLQGHEFFTAPGGKGANQAVALARLGVTTQMVGRVGEDDFGSELLRALKTAGVQTECILVDETANSGVALISVDDSGENQIVIVAGANGCIDNTDLECLNSLFSNAFALLMQFEIPMQNILLAAQAAKQNGIKVILDPAPATTMPAELYPLVDIITPNQIEAEQLVGFPVNEIDSATESANILLQRGVGCAIVKLGATGVICATPEETFFVPAFPVTTIDTVAAGDAFNSALAAALVGRLSLQQAVVWGAAAGALAASKPGAQSSLPTREALMAFLQARRAI